MSAIPSNKQPQMRVIKGFARKYGAATKTPIALALAARNGVGAEAFFDALEVTGFPREKLSEILDISVKTIQRYKKQGKKLNAISSELLLKLFMLYGKGEELFGSIVDFNRWLEKPAYGLANEHPASLMHTSGGMDVIMEELYRIEYGALA